MKSTQYSEKVLDHFRNPRNVGVIENPDGYGKVGNPVCGDLMEIFIKIKKTAEGEEIIDDIKFRTFGCGSAVATSSMITEMAMGMNLDDAYRITRNDVADELEGLPPIKMHCSNLAADALKAAIRNYREGTEPEVEIATSCAADREIKIILGVEKYLGKGVYENIDDVSKFKDKRTIIVDTGDESLEAALKLTKHTGRVILVTSAQSIPGSENLQKKLKLSDVKILYQSELLEITGELGEVERVIIHDFDEEEKYELYVDAVLILK
ncbi:MAG: Fe-S cluster assembly scaffold protein NifU [Candidatus Lokiarchaeota archaeon]|nr:Fe-S cluster assembly scaffold protein NifU [Candidatus Lokiarchaeota archaeon]MBD3341128.1 Fe-S cluster assembly scaffold protein NifU [Candidatus Lokiarchaeota archaeon]